MRRTRRWGRWTLAAVLLAALLGQQAPARAAIAEPQAPAPVAPLIPPGPPHSPPPPPGCVGSTHTFQVNTPVPIPDLKTITSTIPVSGLDDYIWNVTAQTAISHTYSSDLDVRLYGPNNFGEFNTLTTGNGGASDNVFANTMWTDQASNGVTELNLPNNVNQPFLIPEGAMGKHFARNPNGNWNLVVADKFFSDTGSLNRWGLSITTLPFRPIGKNKFATNTTDHPIPNPGTLTVTLPVSGLDSILDDVTLQAYITHTNSGDLKIVLTAPSGLTTTLVNGRADGYSGQYDGIQWTDDGALPVTDAIYQNGHNLGQVQPEGAMRHFAGSNPNGVWTLAITDMGNNPYSGTLTTWQLGVYSSHCAAQYLPVVRR